MDFDYEEQHWINPKVGTLIFVGLVLVAIAAYLFFANK